MGLHYPDKSCDDNDKLGLPIWPGFSQGAPVDEKGHYIYSQIGQPVVPYSPLSIPSVLKPVDEEVPVFQVHQFCLYPNHSPM